MDFIRDLEVINFKKFKHLNVKNIGDFNLITGDNNSGKTSLLESILFNVKNDDKIIIDLHAILCNQGLHFHPVRLFGNNKVVLPKENYIDFLKNNVQNSIKFIFNKNSIEIQDISDSTIDNEDKNLFRLTEKSIKSTDINYWLKVKRNGNISSVRFLYEDDFFKRKFKNFSKSEFAYSPIIKFHNFYENDLNTFFKDLEMSSNNIKELTFYDYQEIKKILKATIIPNLLDIKLENVGKSATEMINVATENSGGKFHNITRYGDGVQKIVRYLLELHYAKKNNYNFILIDEIDTGIHHTRLKFFWKEFLLLCKKLNIQLFATTHSLECIEEFINALEEINEIDNGKVILLQNENDGVKSYTIPVSNYNENLEYRGGMI